jgi:pimeloyl-ACP methyl ester carboxylesterase
MPTVRVGEINIEYYVEGTGPPLLMIMGWIGNAAFWGEPFLERLRPHFQIIRFSNRGTGLTDKPGGDYGIRLMADDAAGLLAELGIKKAHVLGISMGGMIAQELVLNHAQVVQGLALGCTNCGFAHGVLPSTEIVTAAGQAGNVSPQDRMRQYLQAIVTPEFLAKAEVEFWTWLTAMWLAAPTPWETISRHFVAMQAFDTYERLPQVQAPTLIIHGDKDLLMPVENAEVLQKRINGSQALILPGVAHMFFWEKPEESAGAIVEFLASVPAPA